MPQLAARAAQDRASEGHAAEGSAVDDERACSEGDDLGELAAAAVWREGLEGVVDGRRSEGRRRSKSEGSGRGQEGGRKSIIKNAN